MRRVCTVSALVPVLIPFVLLLAGCLDEPPQPPQASGEERLRASEAAFNCLDKNVRGLDDGLSDAHTIAEGLVSACDSSLHNLAVVTSQGLPLFPRAAYLERWKSPSRELALNHVLAYRKEQREEALRRRRAP